MALSNQFNMVDILALTNFPRVRKIMEETLGGIVYERLKKILKNVSSSNSTMTRLRDHNKYVLLSKQKDWFCCELGYWLNSSNITNYPEIGVLIGMPPDHPERQEVVEIMKEIVSQKKWQGSNLVQAKAWSGIFQMCSLQQFLSEDDHIKSIQNQFLHWIEDVELLKKEYPALPWK